MILTFIKVEDILNHVIPHSLNRACEQCEEFENFHFKKKVFSIKCIKYVVS